MMRQLTLPIGIAVPHSFDNFIAGANGLAVEHLRAHSRQSPPVYLWGLSGAGKTHLLQALAAAVQARGGRVSWFNAASAAPWPFEEGSELIVLDDCQRYDALQQQAAFALFVEATTHGIPLAAAGRVPPVDLALRDDLRSRLGWGHVLALQPLSEAESRGALRRDADGRGLFLSDEVIDYLLSRFDRDMKNLVALLDRLDHYAMTTQRAVTVPLIRQMLAEKDDRA
jgi:DnaA family protein